MKNDLPSKFNWTCQKHVLILTNTCALISLWGLLAIYRTQELSGNWQHFLVRQTSWLLIAWLVFILSCKIGFERIFRWCFPLTAIGVIMLALLPLLGISVNHMHGWYDIYFATLQPSELLKGLYILSLIKLLYHPELTPLERISSATALIILFAVLMFIQPDFGTMIVYIAGGVGALFFSRIRLRFLIMGGLAALLASAIALQVHPYMKMRLINFLNPHLDPSGGSWHLRQFAIAAARGEWTGVKSSMAVWSNSFLPLSYNDSIFAGICEMLGFAGGIILILLYIVCFRSIFILGKCSANTPLQRSLIDSMGCMLLIQTMLHILVNLGMIPPTGITLPLISYGGSSLTATMFMLALITSCASSAQTQPINSENNQTLYRRLYRAFKR